MFVSINSSVDLRRDESDDFSMPTDAKRRKPEIRSGSCGVADPSVSKKMLESLQSENGKTWKRLFDLSWFDNVAKKLKSAISNKKMKGTGCSDVLAKMQDKIKMQDFWDSMCQRNLIMSSCAI
jgi:hypothetical protein